MVVFLLSAFICFLIFQIVKFIEISVYKNNVVIYKFGNFALFKTSRDSRIQFFATILLIFILFIAIIRYYISTFSGDLFGFSLTLLDRYAGSILIGFLFGPLFANWLNGVARLKGKETLSSGQVAYGVLLIVLFVAGSLGQETGRIIENYAKNLTKVSVAGVEFGFAEARRSTRASVTDNNIVNPAQTALLPPGTSQGLGAITELANLIRRDCQYISMVMKEPVEKCGSADDTSLAAQFQACNTQQPLSIACMQIEQSAAERSAQKLLVDYGSCLSAAFELGTDSTLIKQRLEGLAPRLREMANPNFTSDDDFKARANATFFHETLALAGYVYPVFLAGSTAQPRKPPPSTLTKACAPSFALLCDDITANPEKREACGREAARLSSPAADPSIYNRLKQARSAIFSDHINQFLKVKDHDKRPYIVTSYAYLMSHLRDYDSALFKLYEWLKLHKATASAEEQDMSKVVGVSNTIYEIRARTTILFVTEEWLRYLKNDASASLREQHIANIESLINLQNSIKSYQEVYITSKRSSSASVQSNFTTANIDKKECSFTEEYKTRLLHNFLSQKLLYAYNAMRHPEYMTTYAPKARAHVLEVVNADLSCILEKPYKQWGSAILNADALDLYAQILWREALNMRKVKGRSSTLADLSVALSAAKLGRTLVAEAKKVDEETKSASDSFIEKISITPTYDTYTSLDRTISTIEQSVADVSEND